MIEQRRLRQEIVELQKQWNLLNEKLSQLEKDKTSEFDVGEKFRLENEITEIKEGLQQFEHQILKLETQLSSETRNGEHQPAVLAFINRQHEIRFLTNVFAPPNPIISAPAGYGKTRLIGVIESQLQRQNWLCVHPEISREKSYSINELGITILESLGETPSQKVNTAKPEALGYETGQSILKVLDENQKHIAIVLDEVENIDEQVIKQLLDQLIPEVEKLIQAAIPSPRLRLILAGRHISHWEKLDTQFPLRSVSLSPFDFSAVCQMIEHFAEEIDKQVEPSYEKKFAAHAMYFTGGHPGCIETILKQDFGSPLEIITSNEEKYYKEIMRPVIEEIKQHIPSELREIMAALSIIRRFNPSLLKWLLNKNLITWDGNQYELEDRLRQHYLVNNENGFLKDNITRYRLVLQLRRTDDKRFLQICEEAMAFYTFRLKEPTSHRPDIIAVELLFQKLLYLFYTQKGVKKLFFAELSDVLSLLVSGRDFRANIESLIESLNSDWEFQFTCNYLLCDRMYSDESVFEELIEKIRNFESPAKERA